MKVTLIQATPNPIETIAQIASICYDSDPKNPLGLVKHLYRNGHHSVFEHIYFTFKIVGVVEPGSICKIDEKGGFGSLIEEIGRHYEELQAHGIPNEDARYVLPNACETSLYLSCNLRELIHMSNERLCRKAQWEIRELVQQMVDLVTPELHFMLVPKCKSGRIICNSPCGKEV